MYNALNYASASRLSEVLTPRTTYQPFPRIKRPEAHVCRRKRGGAGPGPSHTRESKVERGQEGDLWLVYLCVYVCVYIYIYIYIYTYMYMYTYIYIFYMHMCVCVCLFSRATRAAAGRTFHF